MLKTFHGGVHPKGNKRETMNKAIERMPAPKKVVIPVSQHIGAPGVPLVKVGDLVKKGQMIANSDTFVTSAVHASISGKVTDIGVYPSSYKNESLAIVIESDGLDEWVEGLPLHREWETLNIKEIHQIVRDAGIVGLGGANFPSHIKISYGPDKKIDTFILNGSECEPYLNGDYRIMTEHADRLAEGVKIIMKSLNVTRGIVGIEDNKPEAISSMREALKGTGVSVVALPTKYPQGAERMLIKVLTEREIQRGGCTYEYR